MPSLEIARSSIPPCPAEQHYFATNNAMYNGVDDRVDVDDDGDYVYVGDADDADVDDIDVDVDYDGDDD